MTRSSAATQQTRIQRDRAKHPVADGARQVLDAARSSQPDPEELLPATEAELADLRDTEVGRRFGIRSAMVSRDGKTTRLVFDREGPC